MAGGWAAAAAGFAFSWWNSKAQEERKARIERVNTQLREFYGPLMACVFASESAYRAMIKQHSPDGSKSAFQKAIAANHEGPEASAYRLWMQQVLQPLNERAAKVVTENVDLLEEATTQPLLLQLIAHTCAYKVVLERWRQGDVGAYSVISFPDQLAAYISREFSRMKHKQAELLGTTLRSKL